MDISKYLNVRGPQPWAEPVASRNLVVLAASSGGLHALTEVLAALPADFPAAIAVVQHRGEQCPELLPVLLDRCTTLKVRHATDGDLLEPGCVYVCPPGMHMTAEHCVRLVAGPRLDFVRPSVNLMFRSAAHAYGDRAIGVVLSGSGSDGAIGCTAIIEAGGTVVAQEPASSEFRGMPEAAIARGHAELIVPLDQIGDTLRCLVDPPRSGTDCARLDRGGPTIKVLLADDHRILLDGLRTLLSSESDMEVVAEASDGRAAVQLAGELSPDVVVMDIAMPQLNGIEATRRIKEGNARTSIVALSARTDAQAAARIVEAGATGYLCKNAAFSELPLAIRTVAARQCYFSPRVAAIAAAAAASVNGNASASARLTAREREILQLMVEGNGSEQIAQLLGVGLKTVEAHRRRVMGKLGVDNLAGLTRLALHEGLISIGS